MSKLKDETNHNTKHEILIVAAEASSALYAKRLLEDWKNKSLPIHALGVGSKEMEALGFEIIGRSEEMAVVGFQEVLSHYSQIKSVYNQILEQVRSRNIKTAILLDYPGFNLKIAKELKKMGVKIIYYISPQVWAWKKNRIHTIKATVDKMLVLFPFEKIFYDQHGVDSEFIGHPLLEEMAEGLFDDTERNLHRSQFGLAPSDLLLGLMPGSRKSELKHHLKVQIETAIKVCEKHPSTKIALFVAPGLEKELFQDEIYASGLPIQIIQDDPFKMIRLADVILCASGTATLQVGMVGVPLVIMYKMNSLTAWLAKKVVTDTPYFGMINLILNREVAPEYFQEKATPEILSEALSPYLSDAKLRSEKRDQLLAVQGLLGDKGATQRVSRVVQEFCGL